MKNTLDTPVNSSSPIDGMEAVTDHYIWDLSPTRIPAGSYPAVWCGYIITIKFDGEERELRTKDGIRGMITCRVKVDNAGCASIDHDFNAL